MLCRLRRSPKRATPPSAQSHLSEEGAGNDPRWTDADREALVNSIRSLWEARARTPFGKGGSSEIASLLACPRDEIRDQAMSTIGNVNMVAALVFSGLLGPAIQPVATDTYWSSGELQGRCADALNILVAFATAVSALVTFTSTYLIMQVSVEPTTSGIYRSLARISFFFGMVEILTGVMCVLAVAAVLIALALNSSAFAWRIGVALVLVSMFAFNIVFFESYAKAFPDSGLVWATLWWPVALRKTLFEDAKRAGVAKANMAAEMHGPAVFPFVKAGPGGAEEEKAVKEEAASRGSPSAPPPSEEALLLEQLLTAALPQAVPGHVELLSVALLRAGLTHGVLKGAAAHADATSLQQALKEVGDFGARLLPGEVLAIITELKKLTKPEPSPAEVLL